MVPSSLFLLHIMSGEFTGQSNIVMLSSLKQVVVLCVHVPGPAGKWNHNLHKACGKFEEFEGFLVDGCTDFGLEKPLPSISGNDKCNFK